MAIPTYLLPNFVYTHALFIAAQHSIMKQAHLNLVLVRPVNCLIDFFVFNHNLDHSMYA